MNILVVTPYIPHPLAGHGGSEYVYGLIKYLSQRHRVTVLTFLDAHEEKLVKDLSALPIKVRFVRRAKGMQRNAWKNLLLFFLRVSQLARSVLLWQPYYCSKYNDNRMARMVEEETSGTAYDAVQIEFSQMAQYVRYVKSGITVLREHDVSIRPYERMYRGERNPLKKLLWYIEYKRWLSYEPRIVRDFNHVLTFTETDRNYLQGLSGTENIFCNPRGIEIPETVSGYEKREPYSVMFVGVYNHTGNRDSVIWLCSEIFPEIQKRCPQAILYIIGKHPPEEVLKRAEANTNIKVLGFVPSIEEYLNRVSVFISPTRQGGGIKTKILHAQSYAMPVVSTRMGAEGITSADDSTVLLAENAGELAEAVCKLFHDKEMAKTMAMRGRELVIKHYAWASVINDLEKFYSH